ncbi:septum formation family protein [Marinactinospora thermotolerans]|uniref:Septum formation n=1 Tax=Marinactinospora thermotolerans DSM 45154 TaxID=1122192 RepID=A0A1T4NDN7_9ACTN|nr:septum formation family protein [Marinactinospora thermotolerans]SJZ77166.1 Septum formation [Marinactinospora thermotolerans DSM 45154]
MISGTFQSRAGRVITAAGATAAVVGLSGCGLLGTESVLMLSVGDCLPAAAEGELAAVETISCEEPHDSEIYASSTMEGDEYPGDDAVITAAEEKCLAEFEGFVGMAYEESELDISYMYPTQESWETLDDREILCMIYDPAGDTTGTLEQAGR